MMHSTKQRLIDAGLPMLLEQGYNDLGIQALLTATKTPKGSFYHHFRDKEDFALQVIDAYIANVQVDLDACLLDKKRPPLVRVRRFFQRMQKMYREEGYMGCLLVDLDRNCRASARCSGARLRGAFQLSPNASLPAWARLGREARSLPVVMCGRWQTSWSTAGRARLC